jgi:Fe-S oxidoreductase
VTPKRIVTTCPHCLHTLANEYPVFGGRYQVIHHSQLIDELLRAGRLKLKPDASQPVAFHDPCYLGRHNDILIEPRQVLQQAQVSLIELGRHGKQSFCCGAGGAQMWKEEEAGSERVNTNRFREAGAAGAEILAVGCPFCMIMLTDAKKDAGSQMEVLDIAEIVLEKLEK